MDICSMTGHIFIYGGIGTGSGEVSIQNVKSQIDQAKASEDLVLHIVSPGGDVFEGYGIYNILKNTGKKITTHIEGLTASIATLIAFAGERLVMNKTSEFMIHNPKITDLKGESSDLRNVADQLDKIKSLLIDVSHARATRNGKTITNEKLWELYDNETWLTAQEAVQYGFADEVVDAIKAVATVDLKHFKMEKKTNLWTQFKNLLILAKATNEFTEALQDGRIIIVMSEDEDWTSKPVVLEDGSPLEPGDYTLASGKVITVGDGSTITTVTDAPPPSNEEEMNKDNRIKELEAQLAETTAAKETAEAALLTTQTKATVTEAKFKNRVTELERDFLKLKEEAGKTVGDTTPPSKGPVYKNIDSNKDNYDPMGEDFLKELKSRQLI